MAYKKTCERCKGSGGYNALISMHDDETEWVSCSNCNGKGYYYQMTDDEEREYKSND
jgi:DnaJ-class molecular chaperone